MRIRRAPEGQSDLINISSLVDVMFILIIFFLATTTFQQEERDVKVSLPEAGAMETLSSAPKVVVINVREDGTYFLGNRAVTRRELDTAVQQALEDGPDQKVLVRGDRNARHGHVAAAVLASKKAGVHEANIGYQLAP
jgi:biopolymer transport protein ExbD